MINPSGCRWCGIDQREHARQWKPPVGWHQWTQPTQAMILERMRRRRGNRKNAAPALYHAVTGWAADHTGESGEPYCADCKTDGCRPWLRIQARLDEQRWGIPRNPKRSTAGWSGEEPW